jgi:hypothetical protein
MGRNFFKKIIIPQTAFFLFLTVITGCSEGKPPSHGGHSSCLITAKVLAISEQRHDDVMVSRGRYKQRGFTEVFMRLEILRVERLIKGGPAYRKGQVINAYAYKNMDYEGNKMIYKDDVIKAEIVAVPLGDDSFSYKLSKIDKQ